MKATQQLRLSFPASKKYLALVGSVVQEICRHTPGLPESASYNIQLAVDEAVVNVITHAYRDDPSGNVELAFEIYPDRLVIQIRDWGASFDPASIPEPDLSHPQERGYGVYLIRKLMDNVVYQAGDQEGNRVTITKWIKPPAS